MPIIVEMPREKADEFFKKKFLRFLHAKYEDYPQVDLVLRIRPFSMREK